jgi:hypothetical protein
MNTVKILSQHFKSPKANPHTKWFEGDWDLPKHLTLTYTTEKEGQEAAEEAFHLLNAPREYLTKEEAKKVQGFGGHSLSVGDVVEIESATGKKSQFLCQSCGWEERIESPKKTPKITQNIETHLS